MYLSDVTSVHGPHTYVRGSHLNELHVHTGSLSTRVSDEEVERIYGAERAVKVQGSKGTLLVGDTSCVHKGLPVQEGYRLMLQFEYALSLYQSPVLPFSEFEGTLSHNYEPAVRSRLLANFSSERRRRFQTVPRSRLVEKIGRKLSWLYC